MKQDLDPHSAPATLSEIAPGWLIALAMVPLALLVFWVLGMHDPTPPFRVFHTDVAVTQVTQTVDPEADWSHAQQ